MRGHYQRTSALLLALLILLACAVPTVSAASPVAVTVNGDAVTFNEDLGTPFIDGQNRTLVPFRAVANFMDGVEVLWDGDSRMAFFRRHVPVTIDGTLMYMMADVIFPIGTNQEWVDVIIYRDDGAGGYTFEASYSRLIQMDTTAEIYGGRTYAPIRYLAEGLCYTVDWDGAGKTVALTSPDGSWADTFLSSERSKGFDIVGSDSEAYQYACYYMRRAHDELDPSITPLGSDVAEDGTRFWSFYCSSEVIHLNVTQDGEIYVKEFNGSFERWA